MDDQPLLFLFIYLYILEIPRQRNVHDCTSTRTTSHVQIMSLATCLISLWALEQVHTSLLSTSSQSCSLQFLTRNILFSCPFCPLLSYREYFLLTLISGIEKTADQLLRLALRKPDSLVNMNKVDTIEVKKIITFQI